MILDIIIEIILVAFQYFEQLHHYFIININSKFIQIID